MIKDTYSQCVIKSISITKTTALVKLIISSIIDQDIHYPFKFFLKDEDGTITELSNTLYWIDRLSGWIGDNSIININKYKELFFSIDITKENKSEILNKKWYRKCKILLINNTTEDIAWSSEWLELLSKEIELPEIKHVNITTSKRYKTSINLKYSYKSESDFNYNNSHLYTILNVKSILTGKILESYKIEDEDELYSTIEYEFINKYRANPLSKKELEDINNGIIQDTYINIPQIIIEVILKTSDNKIVTSKQFFYTPIPKASNTWVIINGKAHKVKRIYIVPEKKEGKDI